MAAGFLVSLDQNSLAMDEDHCALLKAAAAGSDVAAGFLVAQGSEMRQQVDELKALYRKHETHRGEMRRRHEEERQRSLEMNDVLSREHDDVLARHQREWVAMDSIKEERQRFPDGGSPVEIQVRVEELATEVHENPCVVL